MTESEKLLREINNSLYIGDDLKDPEIMDFYVRVVKDIQKEIQEYFLDKIQRKKQ